jgi:hypothetical protein
MLVFLRFGFTVGFQRVSSKGFHRVGPILLVCIGYYSLSCNLILKVEVD